MKTKIEMICTVRFYSVYTNDNIKIYMNTKTHLYGYNTEANNEFGSSEIWLRIHDLIYHISINTYSTFISKDTRTLWEDVI